jgi:integrase
VKYERAQLVDRDRGTWIDPRLSQITVTEWSQQWQQSIVHHRPKTQQVYAASTRLHILPKVGEVELGSMRLSGVTTEILREWLAALCAKPSRNGTLSAASVHQVYRTLRTMLQAAVECDRLPANPMAAVKPPKVETSQIRFLTINEITRLADAIGPAYRALVLVAAFCGLRASEIAGLQWSDVDLAARRIQVTKQLLRSGDLVPPKTKAGRRSISLPRKVVEALTAHQTFGKTQQRHDDSGFVFAAPSGGPHDIHNFRSRTWKPAVDAAGLAPLRIHDMRHTAASVAIAAHVDIVLLQQMLGHKSAAMTLDRYGHLMPGQSSAMVDRIDALIADSQVGRNAASPRSVAREERGNNAQQHSSSENEKAPGSASSRGFDGGDDGNRTHDPLLAKQVL